MRCFYDYCDRVSETHNGQFVNEYWVCDECEIVYQEFLKQFSSMVEKVARPVKQKTVFYLDEEE